MLNVTFVIRLQNIRNPDKNLMLICSVHYMYMYLIYKLILNLNVDFQIKICIYMNRICRNHVTQKQALNSFQCHTKSKSPFGMTPTIKYIKAMKTTECNLQSLSY